MPTLSIQGKGVSEYQFCLNILDFCYATKIIQFIVFHFFCPKLPEEDRATALKPDPIHSNDRKKICNYTKL